MGSPRKTDNTTPRTYDAERFLENLLENARNNNGSNVTIANSMMYLAPQARFADLRSIQMYCDLVIRLMNRDNYTSRIEPVIVKQAHGNSRRSYYVPVSREIHVVEDRRLGAINTSERIVLHELAHHISGEAHTPKFEQVFKDLLNRMMSPEAAFIYQYGLDTLDQ